MSDQYPKTPQPDDIMATAIHDAFKAVMELGFLYINRQVDTMALEAYGDKVFCLSIQEKNGLSLRPWMPRSQNMGFSPAERHQREVASQGIQPLETPAHQIYVPFTLPTIKTGCAVCKELTIHDSIPYNPTWLRIHHNAAAIKEVAGHQTFVLHYQCQQCKSYPITFLLRRAELKLQLSGRSLPHFVKPPSEIPKALREIYTDAIQAAACNDKPAAFYHWRTLMEHLMKSTLKIPVDEKIEGDVLSDRYNEAIEETVASRASLTDVMRLCSKHLHARTGDGSDLDKVRERIEKHVKLIETLKGLA